MKTMTECMNSNLYSNEILQENIQKIIAQNVIKARTKANISTRKLAEMCGISSTCLYDLEKGLKNIRILTVIRICFVLDISLREIIPDDILKCFDVSL